MPSVAELRTLLDEARAALAAGEGAEAERRAKAVSAIVRAERDVAEFVAECQAKAQEEDADAIRAELRSRFRRLAEAEIAGASDEALERIAAEPGLA